MSHKKSYWLIQTTAAAIVIGVITFLVRNTVINLESRGIATGFAFFDRPAGFDIAFSLFPFTASDSFLKAFWVGLSNTILVSLVSIILASALGLVVAMLRMSSNPLLKAMGRGYIEIFRNLPLLLQLFFWYFVVLRQLPSPRQSYEFGSIALNIRGLYVPFPEHPIAILIILISMIFGLSLGHFMRLKARRVRVATGASPRALMFAAILMPLIFPLMAILFMSPYFGITIPKLEGFNYSGGLQIIPELLALVLALSIYTASFIGEIIRAGVESLPLGQTEASYALGLSKFRAFKEVILPQSLRVIIPPLSSQYMNITKNSSLAAAIAFPDLVLVFAGTSLNITGQALEIMAITLTVYLVLSLSISMLMNTYLKKISLYDAR